MCWRGASTVAQSERLAQMFQDAPSFMAQLDGPEHVFVFTNAAYQQLIGQPRRHRPDDPRGPADIAGQGFFELLDQVYRDRARATAATLRR